MAPTGVVLYPKPAGVTSHDVVAALRRRLPRGTKVGHAGTLDPFATGLLIVLVGRATRAQRFFTALPKTYRARARLGWRSDTGDRDGRLERTGLVPAEPRIPTGRLEQRPPAYSALRVAGERAYRLARRGEAPALEPRPVTVHAARLLERDDERALFEITCSAGTYMRSLVAELGDAYCDALERTAIGPFLLADADPERIVPLERALVFLPERALDADEARRVGHGQRLAAAAPGADVEQAEAAPGDREPRAVETGAAARGDRELPAGEPGAAARGDRELPAGEPGAAGFMRLTHAGRLVAVAEPRAGALRPVVVFAPR